MSETTTAPDAMRRSKPRLTFWEIWNMSFGFLGIQFGFALQNANVSRIFETLGADVEQIPLLWIAAPVTGLIVQPIIGYYSDRTWNRLGRRRPYFLVGAIFASIALCIMPNSPALWVAAGMLWIMDASINISMEPFRAFVGDNLPSEQRTAGFAMQSFFIGIGAVVASALPWMMTNWFGIPNTAPAGVIPPSVKYAFYVGGIIFFLAVLWTVIRSKEYSPEELASFAEQESHYQKEALSVEGHRQRGQRQLLVGIITVVIGLGLTFALTRADLQKELFILTLGTVAAGLLGIVAGALQKMGRNSNALVTVVNDFADMPGTMRQLAVVQFFSWFALFAMWIYSTASFTSHIFGSSDPTSQIYNDGADWVNVCFAVYNGIAAMVAFALPVFARRTSRRVTHMICLILGGIGLISIYFMSSPMPMLLSMVFVGIAWASILSMPYAMLAGALPADKMGYYMGVFNFFIVIPQLVAASILGLIVGRFFAGEAIYAYVVGGVAMILAGLFCLRVNDVDEQDNP